MQFGITPSAEGQKYVILITTLVETNQHSNSANADTHNLPEKRVNKYTARIKAAARSRFTVLHVSPKGLQE